MFSYFFIVFGWGRIFQSAVDKSEVKCNPHSRPNFFPVNVSVLVAEADLGLLQHPRWSAL